MPRGLPEAWLPDEVELPPGAYVESGITLPLNPGRPPVDLMVSDYGTAVVGADAASVCYTLRMANGDAITYCWAVGATPLWIWGLWAVGLVLAMVAALAYFVPRQQPPQ